MTLRSVHFATSAPVVTAGKFIRLGCVLAMMYVLCTKLALGADWDAASAFPVIKEYCFDCHNEEKRKGNVNLEPLLANHDFGKDFKLWELASEMLEFEDMPPVEEEQPNDEEREQLVDFIRGGVQSAIEENAGDPGKVVLRRLTSAEYAYTIQDLTGLNLGLEKTLLGDAVGGEGFSNVGDVQFVQDSTIEQYLKAAKQVASHAVIGAGPLTFYDNPGKTGQELSAINRIQSIYQEHGFSTGAGEGAEAFGLERYPKAFFAAWRYKHRRALGERSLKLKDLAESENLEIRFLEHIWSVLNEKGLRFPSTEIVKAWYELPLPNSGPDSKEEAIRRACSELYDLLQSWQKALAANSIDDEEAPALTEKNFRPTLDYSFSTRVNKAENAKYSTVEISVVSASGEGKVPVVRWKDPEIVFRESGETTSTVVPLAEVVTEETRAALKFGHGVDGMPVEPNEFVTVGSQVLTVQYEVSGEVRGTALHVDVELDIEHGDDSMVRCVVFVPRVEGEEVSATGAASVLLANPNGAETEARKRGVAEFARKLPQVSHRKPAPSDRDPIPEPFDNTYNKPERNAFHYIIKYHRDDRFIYESILDSDGQEELDHAWVDLLTSFDYHDTFIRFIADKFDLELGDLAMADLSQSWIDEQPVEVRDYIQSLYDNHSNAQAKLKAAEKGHLEDTLVFAEQAWRRPLTRDERKRLKTFYQRIREEGELGHDEATRLLLARVLTAPAFLYRIEESPNRKKMVPLSDYALASRLSYFLWSSQPDEELLRVAASGKLKKPDVLVAQTKRMLKHPNARRFATEFFGQWFGFYRFDEYKGVDTTKFTEFTDSLKASMYEEAVSSFEYLVRKDRSVSDILFANHSFLNEELASHYGIDLANTDKGELVKVSDLGDQHRGGLLQLGAVLTVTSAPLRTSAVKRGDWILRRILGTPVPSPPADVGSIPADEVLPDGLTVRQRLEAHRSDASCVNCHSRMDPLGFALENFDPVGRWRDTYADGQAIETSGTLNTGVEIPDLQGLLSYLGENKTQVNRNLSAKLLGYALGRAEIISDRPLIDQMVKSISKDERFSNLVVQVVTSPQFLNQRGRGMDADMAAIEPKNDPTEG